MAPPGNPAISTSAVLARCHTEPEGDAAHELKLHGPEIMVFMGHVTDRVQVPMLVGMVVRDARNAGHQAGVVVVSADVDGPPLGALTWPGIWIVTAQRPAPGTWVPRWESVVIQFEERG